MLYRAPTGMTWRHHASVRKELDRFAGEEVDTAGDGFFAIFDGPTRAIRCALAIVDAVSTLGLEVRAGVHTGEVECPPGARPRGIAVHVAARVAALAGSGEVIVTATTRDLVADHIVLLTAPTSVMIERLKSRTNNPYGKHPDELARVLALKETVEPTLRRVADLEIDTSVPLDEVVEKILAVVSR